MTKTEEIKIGDLNVSKVAKEGLLYTQAGTPYYCSPEVWQDKPYDGKSDIWSLGCVLYELTAQHPPFMANDMKGLCQKVIVGNYPDIPSKYSKEMKELIKCMLQINPHARPSCDQLLKMPALEKLAKEVTVGEEDQSAKMLGTIIVPENLKVLEERLPKANYKTPTKKPASVGRCENEEKKISTYQRRSSADKIVNQEHYTKQRGNVAKEESKLT